MVEGPAYTEFLYLIDDNNPSVSRMRKVMRSPSMHLGIKNLSQNQCNEDGAANMGYIET